MGRQYENEIYMNAKYPIEVQTLEKIYQKIRKIIPLKQPKCFPFSCDYNKQYRAQI